ncbi:MAG: aldo/keto reductase [Paenibacillus sp.]|jgi:hypothetical protein|nr:aldo/keto reductase [Paenibacillus sp.]
MKVKQYVMYFIKLWGKIQDASQKKRIKSLFVGQGEPGGFDPDYSRRGGQRNQFDRQCQSVTGGEAEEILGRAVKGMRDKVVLATKVHGGVGSGPNDKGQSRSVQPNYSLINRAVEKELQPLCVDQGWDDPVQPDRRGILSGK